MSTIPPETTDSPLTPDERATLEVRVAEKLQLDGAVAIGNMRILRIDQLGHVLRLLGEKEVLRTNGFNAAARILANEKKVQASVS